ncbi:MAG: N-acetylmuramoyl-L-alanine amidase [Candidatus Eremiobacterota bacterium]
MFKYILFLIIITVYLTSAVYGQNLLLNGKKIDFTNPPLIIEKTIFLPVEDRGTASIINYFGGTCNCKTEEIYIARDGKPSRFKAGNKDATVCGKSIKISIPPFIQNKILYMSLDDLGKALSMHYKTDKDRNIVLIPAVYKIICKKNPAGYIELFVKASAKIEYNIEYSRESFGIIINIPESFIEPYEVPEEEIIKTITASQKDGTGTIEIILKKPLPVDISSRIDLSTISVRIYYAGNTVTELWLPGTSQEFLSHNGLTKPQLIKNIDFEGDRNIIKIESSGFLKYEWHRMGDNRFYIDFSKAVIKKASLTKAIEDDFISDIKLVQLNNCPHVVRLVFNLKKNVEVTLQAGEKTNELYIFIMKEEKEISDLSLNGGGSFGNPGSDKTIVIDPGHGGRDCGAINKSAGIMEKDLNLDISLKLQSLLVKAGFNAILTRTEDRDVTWDGSPDRMELDARADVGNNLQADVFLSIHNDSSNNKNLNGTCTYYYKDIDYNLACKIQENLVLNLNIANRGLKKANFYVLKHTKMPAVLIEVAFMSNRQNAMLLADPEFRNKAAEGICQGLMEYFQYTDGSSDQ